MQTRNVLASACRRLGRAGGVAVGAVFGASVLMTSVSDVQASERVRWQVPTGFPTSLPGLDAIVPVSQWLSTMSDGSITLRYYEPGELIPPFEILDAVEAGRYDAGFTWIGYDEGTLPATPLFGAVPFGLEPWAYAGWHYFGGGKELLNEMYGERNVHALLCGLIGPEAAGWFREPIESLEDIDGLRIRFAGIGGHVLSQLGASVSLIPGGEVYQALERGVVDAAEFSAPSIDRLLGFPDIIDYYMLPGWHQSYTATHLLVNKDSWEALEERTQRMMETACMAGTMHTLAEGEFLQGRTLLEFEDEGVTLLTLPREILEELKEVTDQVLDDLAEKDEMFGRVLESQRAFAEEYQVWREAGYLPRDFK